MDVECASAVAGIVPCGSAGGLLAMAAVLAAALLVLLPVAYFATRDRR